MSYLDTTPVERRKFLDIPFPFQTLPPLSLLSLSSLSPNQNVRQIRLRKVPQGGSLPLLPDLREERSCSVRSQSPFGYRPLSGLALSIRGIAAKGSIYVPFSYIAIAILHTLLGSYAQPPFANHPSCRAPGPQERAHFQSFPR